MELLRKLASELDPTVLKNVAGEMKRVLREGKSLTPLVEQSIDALLAGEKDWIEQQADAEIVIYEEGKRKRLVMFGCDLASFIQDTAISLDMKRYSLSKALVTFLRRVLKDHESIPQGKPNREDAIVSPHSDERTWFVRTRDYSWWLTPNGWRKFRSNEPCNAQQWRTETLAKAALENSFQTPELDDAYPRCYAFVDGANGTISPRCYFLVISPNEVILKQRHCPDKTIKGNEMELIVSGTPRISLEEANHKIT